MSAVAIIPARLGSTRFPRKALAAETGKPMVVHVCERASQAESVGRVVVATDAEEIAGAVREHGFEAVLTGEHENGTSRVAEAAERLGLDADSVVVNVQGDEPEIEPAVIDAAVGALVSWGGDAGDRGGGDIGGGALISTVASPFGEGEDASDPNIVKAVVGGIDRGAETGRALYFSRALVPFDRDGVGVVRLKHVGLYAYRVAGLRACVGLASTPLERAERLEQLRWLEHGLVVAVAVRETSHHGIDTPEQYAAFVERWRGCGEK